VTRPNPFFTDVAWGIDDVTVSTDMLLFSCSSDNFTTRERSYSVAWNNRACRASGKRLMAPPARRVRRDGFQLALLVSRSGVAQRAGPRRGVIAAARVDDVMKRDRRA
jgi:hypothetical protein